MKRRHKGHKSKKADQNSEWGGEYWKGRPGGTIPGSATKRLTHRLERRIAKRDLVKEYEVPAN